MLLLKKYGCDKQRQCPCCCLLSPTFLLLNVRKITFYLHFPNNFLYTTTTTRKITLCRLQKKGGNLYLTTTLANLNRKKK